MWASLRHSIQVWGLECVAGYLVICPDLAGLQVTGKRDSGIFSRVEVLNLGWVLRGLPVNPTALACHILREDVSSGEVEWLQLSLGTSSPKLTAVG